MHAIKQDKNILHTVKKLLNQKASLILETKSDLRLSPSVLRFGGHCATLLLAIFLFSPYAYIWFI